MDKTIRLLNAKPRWRTPLNAAVILAVWLCNWLLGWGGLLRNRHAIAFASVLLGLSVIVDLWSLRSQMEGLKRNGR